MAIFLSIVGWRLLSLVRPSGGQQVASVQQLRVAVPVVGALVVLLTVYVQVRHCRRLRVNNVVLTSGEQRLTCIVFRRCTGLSDQSASK